MHPKSYIDTTDRRGLVLTAVKVEVRTGAILLLWINPEFYSVGEARSQNSIFSRFRVPFDYPAHSLQETVLPKPMVPMESRDSEGVLFFSSSFFPRWRLSVGLLNGLLTYLLVWRVCDQAFGRYGAEKWSHEDHHEN